MRSDSYYDTYRRRDREPRPRRKRRSFGAWLLRGLLRLVALTAVVAVIFCGIMYVLPPSMFMVEPTGVDLSPASDLPGDCINILLLGTDLLRDSAQRSDAILIASIGPGKFKLTSVMRDTVIDIPGHGQSRINAAFAYGGAELAMRTLNQNFGLNILHYAQVDFVSLVNVIDAIGGVDLTISEAEREQINHWQVKVRRVFEPLGYPAKELLQSGENVHLDGLQALSYARIRKIDSDYARTDRQRKLIGAMVATVRKKVWDPLMWARAIKTVFSSVKTNMTPLQMISLGEKALIAGSVETLRMPVSGSFEDDGYKLNITDINANRNAFINFVYTD